MWQSHTKLYRFRHKMLERKLPAVSPCVRTNDANPISVSYVRTATETPAVQTDVGRCSVPNRRRHVCGFETHVNAHCCPPVFAELCIRQSKSDPVLLTLSQSSLLRCSDAWDSIEDLAQQAADASFLTIEGLKRQYNSCST